MCGLIGAAAYFEQGDYDQSIEACQKAVDEGREVNLLFWQTRNGYSLVMHLPRPDSRGL
jgi:hypothetical protein